MVQHYSHHLLSRLVYLFSISFPNSSKMKHLLTSLLFQNYSTFSNLLLVVIVVRGCHRHRQYRHYYYHLHQGEKKCYLLCMLKLVVSAFLCVQSVGSFFFVDGCTIDFEDAVVAVSQSRCSSSSRRGNNGSNSTRRERR